MWLVRRFWSRSPLTGSCWSGIAALCLCASVQAQVCAPNPDLNAPAPLRLLNATDFAGLNTTPSNVANIAVIEADRISGLMRQNGNNATSWQAEGRVQMWRYPYRLITESLIGDSALDLVQLPQPFRIEGKESAVSLMQGELIPSTGQVSGEQGEFLLQPSVPGRAAIPFRGQMAQLSSPTPTTKRWREPLITSCPLYARDWDLSAAEMNTNEETGIGNMSHAVLRLAGVPVFYWPWLDFPLYGQRKSGFLPPILSQSNDRVLQGNNIGLPYYFNLAPNYDWLFTPYSLAQRGIRLDNEVGYLFANASGKAYINVLQHDQQSAVENVDDKRARYVWQHNQNINDHLSAKLLWNHASDAKYLQDFSSDPLYTPTTVNLPQEFRLSNRQQDWTWSAALLDFQALTATPRLSKPYQRYPLITFSSPRYQPFASLTQNESSSASDRLLGETNLLIDGEYSRFRHDFLPNIERTFLYPKWQWQREGLAGFFNTQLGAHLSRYRVQPNALGTNAINQTRVLPILKMSGGANFDRPIFRDAATSANEAELGATRANDWLQTLEPALYWLYIPYRKQSDLPVIDTSRPDFQLGQLDVDNNFSGWDRISDTHQLTFGLTSKILDDQRREVLTLSAGQRLFLQDRRVVLPGEATQKSGRGDFVMNALYRSEHWRHEAKWRYDPQLKKTGSAEGLIAYQSDDDFLMGVRQTYQRQPVISALSIINPTLVNSINLQKTLDGVVDVNVGKGWHFSGRNYYALEEKLILETQVALRYQTCCLAITLSRSNALLSSDRLYRTQWALQFSLLGLTQIGKRSDATLDAAFSSFRVR